MNRHRILALGLILVEAATVGIITRTILFPAVSAAVAVFGCFFARGKRVSPTYKAAVLAVLGAVFMAGWLVLPLSSTGLPASHLGSLAAMHALAKFLIASQLLEFFVLDARAGPESSGGGWPSPPYALPFSGVVVMACISSVYAEAPVHSRFAILAACFTLFFILYFGSRDKPITVHVPGITRGARLGRIGIHCIIIAMGLGIGIVMSLGMKHALPAIDRWVEQLISPASGDKGYSTTATLDSVETTQQSDADRIALRVFSRAAPGYLRALAFEKYTTDRWQPSTSTQKKRPATGTNSSANVADKYLQTFQLRRVTSTRFETMNVWQYAGAGAQGLLFLPVSTAQVLVGARSVQTDWHQCVWAPDNKSGTHYSAFAASGDGESPGQSTLDAPLREQCLAVPAKLPASVRKISETLFRDAGTAQEKIDAVEEWFSEWTYKFGIQVPAGEDPLEWFLVERPPAHCEYFATAATILLRLGGVPARYVTGFVVAEHNRAGGYWLARNQDAHAWVEAWVQDEGGGRWTVVEPTPPEGVPALQNSGMFSGIWDKLSFLCSRFGELLKQGDLSGILRLITEAVAFVAGSRVFWAVAVLLGLSALAWRRWKRLRRRDYSVIPAAVELNRLLVRVDHNAAKRGLHRLPAETLLRFACRIEPCIRTAQFIWRSPTGTVSMQYGVIVVRMNLIVFGSWRCFGSKTCPGRAQDTPKRECRFV